LRRFPEGKDRPLNPQPLTFPAFDPVIFTIGPLAIRWYALAYIAGIFLAWWYAKRLVNDARLWGPRGAPVKALDLDDFVVWAALGVVVGGRLGYVLFYDLAHYIQQPLDIFAVWHGGMSFHGGFLGMMLAMTLFARGRHIPAWSLIDIVATGVPFGLFFGRIANFINGELWGRVTDVPWGMVFCNEYILDQNGGICPAGEMPRHPSQLYEAALEGLVLFLVIRIATHRLLKLQTRGFVSGVFCTGYGIARTFCEMFREADVQVGYFFNGHLTEGMLLSIPMILFGIGLMVWSSRREAAAA
jgi:phosphatidylglycerol:prolipoprotein diacylglycerol transferase